MPGSLEGRGGALREAPPTSTPPRPGLVGWGGRGAGRLSRCHQLSQRPPLGCQDRGLGTARLWGLPRRRLCPRRPSPGPAALWTQARAPGARPAQPHRPPALAPGSRVLPAAALGCGRCRGCAPGALGPAFPPALRLCPGRFASCPERCASRFEGGWIWGLLFASLPQSPDLGFRVESGLSWPSPRLPCPLFLPGEGRWDRRSAPGSSPARPCPGDPALSSS